MSEKVKLTREQAEAIERGIKIYGETRIMNDHEPDAWVGNLVNLNGITKDEMARALYIGYEVEETFKVGDWVVSDYGEIGIITKIEHDIITIDVKLGYKRDDGEPAYINTVSKYYRHATPEEIAEEKERRWWAKHGRDVWELKINDVLLRNDGACVSVFHVDESQERYELVDGGAYQNCYEVNKEIIKEFYKVICFAEDRKDINGGGNE